MEFTGDRNESRPRHFPNPLPPPHGDIHLAVQRRQELLWELDKERIRQDILLRELAETERAMAARFASSGHWPLQALPPSQVYWHQRRSPFLQPWDEAAPRAPPTVTEHPPCSSVSHAAVRPTPIYPHLERSMSAVLQPCLVDDNEKKQEGESSGMMDRPMLRGDLEGCPSPSRLRLPEGALVPVAANGGAATMLSASFAKEVAQGERVGIGGEHKHDVEDGHGVQPLRESGGQSSEQRKTAESTINDQKDDLVARLCQYSLAGQENGTSDEQNQIRFREPAPQAEETHSSLKRKLTATGSPDTGFKKRAPETEETPSGVKRKLTATGSSPVTEKKQKTLGKWNCDLCQVSTTCQRNLVQHRAGKMHMSKLQARNKTSEAMPGSPPSRRNSDTSVAEKGRGGGGTSRREKPCGAGNAARPAEEDEDRKPALSRWTCRVCDAKCTSASNLQEHLGGKRHRENTEDVLAKNRGCYSRSDAEPGKSLYHCIICDAHCNGDTMLASHLAGRRHREALEGRN